MVWKNEALLAFVSERWDINQSRRQIGIDDYYLITFPLVFYACFRNKEFERETYASLTVPKGHLNRFELDDFKWIMLRLKKYTKIDFNAPIVRKDNQALAKSQRFCNGSKPNMSFIQRLFHFTEPIEDNILHFIIKGSANPNEQKEMVEMFTFLIKLGVYPLRWNADMIRFVFKYVPIKWFLSVIPSDKAFVIEEYDIIRPLTVQIITLLAQHGLLTPKVQYEAAILQNKSEWITPQLPKDVCLFQDLLKEVSDYPTFCALQTKCPHPAWIMEQFITKSYTWKMRDGEEMIPNLFQFYLEDYPQVVEENINAFLSLFETALCHEMWNLVDILVPELIKHTFTKQQQDEIQRILLQTMVETGSRQYQITDKTYAKLILQFKSFLEWNKPVEYTKKQGNMLGAEHEKEKKIMTLLEAAVITERRNCVLTLLKLGARFPYKELKKRNLSTHQTQILTLCLLFDEASLLTHPEGFDMKKWICLYHFLQEQGIGDGLFDLIKNRSPIRNCLFHKGFLPRGQCFGCEICTPLPKTPVFEPNNDEDEEEEFDDEDEEEAILPFPKPKISIKKKLETMLTVRKTMLSIRKRWETRWFSYKTYHPKPNEEMLSFSVPKNDGTTGTLCVPPSMLALLSMFEQESEMEITQASFLGIPKEITLETFSLVFKIVTGEIDLFPISFRYESVSDLYKLLVAIDYFGLHENVRDVVIDSLVNRIYSTEDLYKEYGEAAVENETVQKRLEAFVCFHPIFNMNKPDVWF
jgi:hypothetical protein